MEIHRDDKKKVIEIWLTQKEQADEDLQRRLRPMYAQWKQEKYTVAVFRSGREDLRMRTADLLAHNKKVLAERAAARERSGEQKPAQRQAVAER